MLLSGLQLLLLTNRLDPVAGQLLSVLLGRLLALEGADGNLLAQLDDALAKGAKAQQFNLWSIGNWESGEEWKRKVSEKQTKTNRMANLHFQCT